MKWSYTSYLMRQARYDTTQRVKSEAEKAKEAAIGLESTHDVGNALLDLVREGEGGATLVYLQRFGKTRQSEHAESVWSLMKHVAHDDRYAACWAIVPDSDPVKAVRLDWKRSIVQDVVRLVEEKIRGN
jgi:hypothetical protein